MLSSYAPIISAEKAYHEQLSGISLQLLLRASIHDGQVRPKTRKVHGLLPHVQRRCRPQGCQRRCCHHQDQENHPVRRLVPNRFQVRYQLPSLRSSPESITSSISCTPREPSSIGTSERVWKKVSSPRPERILPLSRRITRKSESRLLRVRVKKKVWSDT